MQFPPVLILIVLASLAMAPAEAVATANGSDGQWQSIHIAQQNGPSLSEAVDQVRRQYRGRIVSAVTRVRGNREVHIIKVLTEDGKVKTVRVAGRTRSSRG